MSTTPSIVTLTLNPALDTSSRVEQVVPERKLRCEQPRHDPGGGGINVARAIAELGGDVAAYWTCGGATGALLGCLLADAGIDERRISTRATTRENLIVFEESSEQQFRFIMPSGRLTEEETQCCIDTLRAIAPPPDYLVLSGSLPSGVEEDLYARIAKSMRSDCRVVLDTSGSALLRGLDGPIFLLKPNLRELEQLAERPIGNDLEIREVTHRLIREKGVKIVVTSLSSAGVVLTTADGHHEVRAPTVKIRSKVGAGDSTVAGIVLELSRGKSVLDAVRFGVAAGSAAVMTAGTELCRREDAERLHEQMTGGG